MSKLYDLAVPVDRYTKDGQEKTKWLNVGVVLQTQNGQVMKLECVPTSVVDKDGNKVPFTGWVNMFEAKDNQKSKPAAHSNKSGGVPDNKFDEVPDFTDVPF